MSHESLHIYSATDGSTPAPKDERLVETKPKLSNIIASVTAIGIG